MSEIPTPAPYRFRTECRSRRGFHKMHTSLGHAKSAINGSGGGKIFEWVDSEWKLLYDVESLPAPWQIEGIEKKRKADEERIDINRGKVERTARARAVKLWYDSHPGTHQSSFVAGFVAAVLSEWDSQTNWSKIMWTN